jgi:cell division transport system permease protein
MATNKRPTYFYATMSTSIVLVLISLFLLLFFHSTQITNIVRENINLLVELEEQMPQVQIQAIQKNIGSIEGVKPGSVRFVSRGEALQTMAKELNLSQEEGENPFRDLIVFNLLSEYYSDAKLRELKDAIELEKGVTGVYFENDNVAAIKANLEKVALGILILALCFVVLAVAIIFNTIKLTLYSDQKMIQTMQMVGADDAFIRKPYLQAAFWMSLQASVAVLICVLGLCVYLIQSGNIFGEIIQWQWVGVTILLSAIVSFVIQFSSTLRIINSYLRQQAEM